jgi:hypothetical protein
MAPNNSLRKKSIVPTVWSNPKTAKYVTLIKFFSLLWCIRTFYSKQPFINELSRLGEGDRLELTDSKGRRHCYHWINKVPLNGAKDADDVNFFRFEIISKDNKVTFQT